LSPKQTQAIGYVNIPSHLPLALGLCISWVVEKNFVKNRQLIISMVKYDFCCSSINYWRKCLLPTQTQAIDYVNIPSDL